MKKVRWGILGAANIARKNWMAIRNSGNGTVVAVGSRDTARAQQFIDECHFDAPMEAPAKALGSYEAVLQDPHVEAVYIPLPTGVRKEWVIRAAESGKHVLCEKPCATSVGDLEEMIQVCRRRKVQFMDGVMFMHSARLQRLRKVLASEIGQVKRITSAFSFVGDEEFFAKNIRISRALEPFGCLGDLGWYCIRLALCVMNGQMPERVTGRTLQRPGKKAGAGPAEFSGELFFRKGVSSSFYCSFLTETEQWAHVSGDKGLVTLNDFVLPFFGNQVSFEVGNPVFNLRGCHFRMEPHLRRVSVDEYSNSDPTSQETNLFRNFANLVLSGKCDPYWPEIALKTQRVMEACLESSRRGAQEVKI